MSAKGIEGLVLGSNGSHYVVRLDSGNEVLCTARGKLRTEESTATNPVAAGDRVWVEGEAESHVIAKVQPRKNYVARSSPRKRHGRHVLAANLDQAVLVVSLIQPRIKFGFCDRFLAACEMYHVPPLIIANKSDLLNDKEELEMLAAVYWTAGYEVISASMITGEGVDTIRKRLHGKVSLLAGHSGVGKSSLTNTIAPNADQTTGVLSDYTGKGQHVTTFASMFEIPGGGWVVDTPGIKELALLDLEPEEVSHYFPEMRQRLVDCRFNNCTHRNEPGCAIIEGLENGEIAGTRYNNYLHVLSEIEDKNYWER